MAVVTISAILGGLGGALAWFNSLPPIFKYILFLAGLSADAGAFVMTGLGKGLIAGALNLIFQQGFGLPIELDSFQLLIVFIMIPIMFYCLKH